MWGYTCTLYLFPVQGPEDEEFSSDHTPSPPPLTPTRELELTPSLTPSPPPLCSHSSPHSHLSHKPVVVRHDVSSIEGELVSNFQSGGPPISDSAPREKLVIENISSSSEGGGTREGKLEPPEGPPQQQGESKPQLDTRALSPIDRVSVH